MKENGLLVWLVDISLKEKLEDQNLKPAICNHIWGTDITKVKLDIWGYYYLVIVLEWYTKEIICYHVSLQSKRKDWQVALEETIKKCFPEGIKESLIDPFFLVSDNDCQPTSSYYMKAYLDLGIKQIFTSRSKPRARPTMKE